MSHTPGPWRCANHRNPRSTLIAIIGPDGTTWPFSDVIAEVLRGEANARLIAAAPDLLAAGQAVLASLDAGTLMEQRDGVVRDVAAVSRLRAAVAKAESQP